MIQHTDLYRTFKACAWLKRHGCRVLEAHAHVAPPLIRISAPPPGVLCTYGFRSPPVGAISRVPVCCVAQVHRVRVEWDATEAHA